MKTTSMILAAVTFLTVASCQKNNTAGESTSTPEATASSLQSIVLEAAPSDAQSIAEARANELKVGQTITIKGKVMGRIDPFVSGRAMLVMGDPAKLTSCDTKDCSECETPWDVCCDDPDDIKSFTATVQVLDSDGKLIKQGLKNIDGVKELSQLIVKGTVAEGSNPDNLLINATGIHIQP